MGQIHTAPTAPSRLRVLPDPKVPETSLRIYFDHERGTHTVYVVSLRSMKTKEITVKYVTECFACIDELTPGDKYEVSVVARNGGRRSAQCKIEEPVQTYPSKPDGIIIEQLSESSCKVHWNKVFGASSYSIKYKKTESNCEITSTKDTECTIEELDSDQTYTISVAAMTPNCIGAYSNSQIFVTGRNTLHVEAQRDLQNPYRQIIVTWKHRPLRTSEFYYKVCLESSSGNVHVQFMERSDNHTHFANLKPDNSYVAYVSASRSDGKALVKSVSEPVSTKKGKRDPDFNIKLSGKPVIDGYWLIPYDEENMNFQCWFSWTLANLGNEAKNFELVCCKAFVEQLESAEKKKVDLCNNTETKSFELEFQISYKFHVVCSYKDLDSCEILDSTCSVPFKNELSPPMLNVNWEKGALVSNWKASLWADEHNLVVYDETEEPLLSIAVGNDTDDMIIDFSEWWGKRCKFVLEATRHLALKTGTSDIIRKRNITAKAEKKVLIGGEIACTHVISEKDPHNPRRGIMVTWKPPVIVPTGYKVEIF